MPPAIAAWIAAGINGSTTDRKVTLAPSFSARAKPCLTPLPASSEPSVAITIFLYIGFSPLAEMFILYALGLKTTMNLDRTRARGGRMIWLSRSPRGP